MTQADWGQDSSMYVQGATGLWKVVIGLEVHAQIQSVTKLFSRAPTAVGAAPNTQVAFLDMGLPGTLPVLNRVCVDQAIKTGLGLEARISKVSDFDRKNYFYPDLPTGYQITQFHRPIVIGGHLDIETEEGGARRVRIHHIHLEQDAGKSLHDQHPDKTYIDLNRAGVGLMELVTEPDMRSAAEVVAFMRKLRTLFRYLGTCDGNMAQGRLRADINVSVHRPGTPLGTRAEVKNVNAIAFFKQAVEYEIQRQVELLEAGGVVVQETRLFDEAQGVTRSMRTKEEAHDYRYFSEPDLPTLVLTDDDIEAIRQTLPELPDAKKARLRADYDLSDYDADQLVEDVDVACFYEEALAALRVLTPQGAKWVANWMLGDLFAALNRDNKTIREASVLPRDLAALVDLIQDDVISGKIAKDVFQDMWATGDAPGRIVENKGLQQITDDGVLDRVVDAVLAASADNVQAYRAGKEKLFGFFVGQVMKELDGKANPAKVNEKLRARLDDSST